MGNFITNNWGWIVFAFVLLLFWIAHKVNEAEEKQSAAIRSMCPYCRSKNISPDEENTEDGLSGMADAVNMQSYMHVSFQPLKCIDCKKTWWIS
jgi:hypothetical protein